VTKVALSREITNMDEIEFRAITAHNQAAGRTPGETLDALATQLPAEDADTLIIVRGLVPDRYFTTEQRDRLQELMGIWRSARDQGQTLSEDDQNELEKLIDLEVQAAAHRTTDVIKELAK
jgi:hypothetical protein